MKTITIKITRLLTRWPRLLPLATAILAVSLNSAQSAVMTYGFDSATVQGKTVLVTGNIIATNVSGVGKTFDTTTKAEGTASLYLTGTGGSNFGYFSTPIKIGLLSTNGVSQDLKTLDANISFQYRIANNPEFTHNLYGSGDPNIRIRLYQSSDGSGNHVADYYTTTNATNTGGNFLTLSTTILASMNGTLVSGWSWGSGFGMNDLSTIGSVRIMLGYSYSLTINSTALDYHLDDLQVSGSNVTMIPEPSTSALVFMFLLVPGCFLIARRRVSALRS